MLCSSDDSRDSRTATVPGGTRAMPQQQTTPPPTRTASPPPTGRPVRSWAARGGGGVVLLLVLLGTTTALTGCGGSSAAAGSVGTATGGPSGAATGAGPAIGTAGGSPSAASGGGSSHVGSGATASVGPVALTHPVYRLAATTVRTSTAALLEADDSHYRTQLATGESLLGRSGFAAWSAAILADTTDRSDAARADTDFTASDRPPALNTWHADNGIGAGLVRQFARDGADGASIATRTDAADALSYLADADRLAQQVSAGD